jgi:hypothetical protein
MLDITPDLLYILAELEDDGLVDPNVTLPYYLRALADPRYRYHALTAVWWARAVGALPAVRALPQSPERDIVIMILEAYLHCPNSPQNQEEQK